MKKLILLFVLTLVCQTINAQVADSNQSSKHVKGMNARVDSIEKRLDPSQYTRIPNKDFENILNGKVREEVFKIAGIFAAFLTFVGFFVAKTVIKNGIEIESENLKKKLEAFTEFGYKNEINKIRIEFEEYKVRADKQEKEEKESYKRREKLVQDIRYDKHKTRYQELVKKAKNGRIQQDDKLEKDLQSLLEDSELIQYNEMTKETLDVLAAYLYNVKSLDNKHEKLAQLLDVYENKNSDLVSGIAFTKSVLIQFNRYFNSISFENFDKFLESLSILERKIPDYGHASALRLEVFMMQYKITSDKEKEKINDQILTLLNQIYLSHEGFIVYETVERLRLDSTEEPFASNVNDLYALFPDELKKIEEKTRRYLSDTYKATGNEEYMVKFYELFPGENSINLDSTDASNKNLV